MIIHNTLVQGTPEWFAIRADKVSASHATAIASQGKGLDTYVNELMADYFSCKDKEHFSNEHTDRGNELEPIARVIYELENGVKVEQVGFIEYSEYVGCSPDGLIGDNGGLEIKSPDDKAYFKVLMGGESEIDTGYIWQVQMSLLITGREYWDLCFYNPNFKKSTVVFRIKPDLAKFEKLKGGFALAEEKIKLLKKQYQKL